MKIEIDLASIQQLLEQCNQNLMRVNKETYHIKEGFPLVDELSSRLQTLSAKLRQEKIHLLDALIRLAKPLGLMQFSVGKIMISTDPNVARIYLSYKGREARPRSYDQILISVSNSEFCSLCEDMARQIQRALEGRKAELRTNQDTLRFIRNIGKSLSVTIQDI
jgi:hypothetical protein